MSNAETKLRTWGVTVPIAGHCYITVEAATEEEAIDMAIGSVSVDNMDSWEALMQFHKGNVCYCPQPWEAEATDETMDED